MLPLRTQNIEVAFSTSYRVRYASGDVQDEVFTAVTCRSTDPPIVRYFFSLMSALVSTLGTSPSVAEVETAVRSAAQLFQAFVLPAAKTVQGVWAELLIIAASQVVSRAASAWHSAPEERYDFALGPQRLEVKSSAYRQRVHHFSLEQLLPPAGSQLWIASVFVERSSGGLTLEALLREITGRVGARESVRIQRVVAESLGSGFANALDIGFDRQLAVDSLRYYPSELVPQLPMPLPPAISAVHFRADLTAVPFGPLPVTISAVFPPAGTGG